MGKIILSVKKISKSYNNGEKELHVLQDLSLKVLKKKLLLLLENQVLENQHYLIF